MTRISDLDFPVNLFLTAEGAKFFRREHKGLIFCELSVFSAFFAVLIPGQHGFKLEFFSDFAIDLGYVQITRLIIPAILA